MVIIGAGQSGVRAALTLRESGWDGSIILIGEETHTPYERPPLSKVVLLGEIEPESCAIINRSALAEVGIEFISGTRAKLIDRATKTITLADERQISYHKLLIATGARARRITVPGSELNGIYYLRTLEHAIALREALKPGSRLAVIGGGFIGLEAAASAMARGCSVTVIELGPRLLTRAVPEEIATLLAVRHGNAGVAIRCDTKTVGFEGKQAIESVQLDSGASIPCDMALIGIGAEPEPANRTWLSPSWVRIFFFTIPLRIGIFSNRSSFAGRPSPAFRNGAVAAEYGMSSVTISSFMIRPGIK